jgi:drug/metabolite transporter (DMT)-like permease
MRAFSLAMGIVYGLLAALGWGLADYIVTCLTRRVGTPRAMVYAQVCSLLAWVILLILPAQLLWGRDSVAQWSGLMQSEGGVPIWAWVIGAGLCHVLGLVLSYRAFEIGTLALVSPMASSFAVVTAVLSVATQRDVLPPHIIVGAALLFGGILLATRAPSHGDESNKGLRGVPEALGCALGFGVMFWMWQPISQNLGPVVPLIVLKIMSSALALVGLRAAKHTLTPVSPENGAPAPRGLVLQLAIGIAIVDSLAWLAFNTGERLQYTTVVTALASLFSVVTILLAWLLLKDRLARIQWVGIAIILGGVLMVSLPAEQVNELLKKLGLAG